MKRIKYRILLLTILLLLVSIFTLSIYKVKAVDINDKEYLVSEFTVTSANSSGTIALEHIALVSGDNTLTLSVTNFKAKSHKVCLHDDSYLYFLVPQYVTKFSIVLNNPAYPQEVDINGNTTAIDSGEHEISVTANTIKSISVSKVSDGESLNYLEVKTIKFYSKFSDYNTIIKPKIKLTGEEVTKTAIKFGANIEKSMYEEFVSLGFTFGVKISYVDGESVLHERCFDLPDGVVKLLNDSGEIDVNGTYYQFYCVLNLNLHLTTSYTGKVYAYKDAVYYYFNESTCSFQSLMDEYYNGGLYISGLSETDKYRISRYFARLS